MADNGSIRLKLSQWHARLLHGMLARVQCDEIEEMMLRDRIHKSIETFLIIDHGYTKAMISATFDKAPLQPQDASPEYWAAEEAKIDALLAETRKEMKGDLV